MAMAMAMVMVMVMIMVVVVLVVWEWIWVRDMGYGMLDIGYLYCSWVRDIDMVVDGCSGSGG